MMGDKNNTLSTRWMKTAEFQGYIKGKLEGFDGEFNDMKDMFCKEFKVAKDERKEARDEIKVLHKRITGTQVKVAGISASVALIITLVVLLIKGLLAK